MASEAVTDAVDETAELTSAHGMTTKAATYPAVGDVVRLKSGGPDMTVNGVEDVHHRVSCTWFAGKKLERGYFAPETLVPTEAP